jgi:PAS domain S-box-containing protein
MDKKLMLETLHKKMIAEIQDYAIILLDIDGTILSWNKGAEKIKGYKEEEILGQNFGIFYLPQDRQAGLPEQLIAQAIKEGRARHI